jgi:hypothetical protein
MSAGAGSSTDPFNIDDLNRGDDDDDDELNKNLTPEMVKQLKIDRENFILLEIDKLPEELRELIIGHHANYGDDTLDEILDSLERLENINRLTLNQKGIENSNILDIHRNYNRGTIDYDTAIRRLDSVNQKTEDLATINRRIIEEYESELQNYFTTKRVMDFTKYG